MSRALRLCVVLLLLSAASAEAKSLTLAWDPNPEPDIAGYIVEYSTQPFGSGTLVNVGTATTWTLQNASATATYYFYVMAYNAAGVRSARSAQVVALPDPTNPLMSIDTPGANGQIRTPFSVAGWAVDLASTTDAGVNAVHVWAYPNGSGQSAIFLGAAQIGLGRPDVASAMGAPFATSGFALSVASLAPGNYDIVVFARSRIADAFNNSRAVRIRVLGPDTRPYLAVDTIRDGQAVSNRFSINGWTLDAAATDGTTGADAVHVWAYPTSGGSPVFAGAATMGLSRPDVGALFGAAFTPSGFALEATLNPGSYRLVISARSRVTGTFSAAVEIRVTVQNTRPLMAIDTPRNGTTIGRNVTIAGWAIDAAATSGAGVNAVHVWAYPQTGAPFLLGAAVLGVPRPDIGAAFGSQFSASGYRLITVMNPGRYQLVVFARSTVTGTYNSTVVNVTVQ